MPIYPRDGLFTTGRMTKLPKNLARKKDDHKKEDGREKDGLGPGAYVIKVPRTTPVFSFGGRFNSSIRSKDHLRPTKVDGPGPGAYKMPSSIRTGKRTESHMDALKASTFGKSNRNFTDLPQENPGPGKYYPIQFTEASHGYTIPREVNDMKALESAKAPGPETYFS